MHILIRGLETRLQSDSGFWTKIDHHHSGSETLLWSYIIIQNETLNKSILTADDDKPV